MSAADGYLGARVKRRSPLLEGEGQGEGCDLSGKFSSLTPTLSRTGEGAPQPSPTAPMNGITH